MFESSPDDGTWPSPELVPVDFSHERQPRSMHAGATHRRQPRTGVGAPRPSGIGLGEPGASAAADGDETFREPPAPRTWRSAVLDRLGASLAELAHGVGGRAAGHRCPMASRLAPPPMDPTFETTGRRPPMDQHIRVLVRDMATA